MPTEHALSRTHFNTPFKFFKVRKASHVTHDTHLIFFNASLKSSTSIHGAHQILVQSRATFFLPNGYLLPACLPKKVPDEHQSFHQ
jgi:hypothetical protein